MVATLPYGSWPSPIAPEDLAAGTVKFEQTAIDGTAIWWVESRPDEQGRSVVMRWTETGGAEDITPPGYSASTTINGYGGGALGVRDGTAWFSNLAKKAHPGTGDLRVHRQVPGHFPEPVTPLVPGCYAEFVPDPARRIVFAVHQDPDRPLHGQARQTLVALDMEGRRLPVTLAEGGDFYSCPRLSPDGRQLAWLTWDYPSMPWDGTRLQVAELDATGGAVSVRTIGGAPAAEIDPSLNPVFQAAKRYSDESILEPLWGPDGTLYCVSDRSEIDGARWWNIHRVEGNDLVPVTHTAAEFASPPWRAGGASYAILADGDALATYSTGGVWRLARVCLSSGTITDIDTPYTSIAHLHAGDGFAVFIGGRFTAPAALVRMDLTSGEMVELRSANPGLSDAARTCLSEPEVIDFATGPDNGAMTETAQFNALFLGLTRDIGGPDLVGEVGTVVAIGIQLELIHQRRVQLDLVGGARARRTAARERIDGKHHRQPPGAWSLEDKNVSDIGCRIVTGVGAVLVVRRKGHARQRQCRNDRRALHGSLPRPHSRLLHSLEYRQASFLRNTGKLKKPVEGRRFDLGSGTAQASSPRRSPLGTEFFRDQKICAAFSATAVF